MVRLAASLLILLATTEAAEEIQWNNGERCMDVDGFYPASAPWKPVYLRHCSGNGNQQFYQDGNQIRWQGNSNWCLGLGGDDGNQLIAGPNCEGAWTITCPSVNNCNYQYSSGGCITTPGYRDTSVQGDAFDLNMGDCNSNGGGFSPLSTSPGVANYMFYLYQDFAPVPNGQCHTGLKGNASLGASSPAAGQPGEPVAIQSAYHIVPSSMLSGSGQEYISYSDAANKCMQMGSGCTGFSFDCAGINDPDGCGVCDGSDKHCAAKFPPNSQVQYSTLPVEDLVSNVPSMATYTKFQQWKPSPSPSPSSRCAVSNPTDCGFVGITEDQCNQNNCCWVPGGNQGLWCFYPNSAKVAAVVV